MDAADEFLDSLEADDRARLYRARWDEVAAGEVVPRLAGLLAGLVGGRSRDVTARCLGALVVIGPAARGALDAALPHLASGDQELAGLAAHAVGRVALGDPAAAVGPLADAFRPGIEEPVMLALLGLGPAAQAAAPVFARAFGHGSARVRRLALRGLKEIEAPAPVVEAVLARARADRSGAIREYARKLFPRRGPAEPSAAADPGGV